MSDEPTPAITDHTELRTAYRQPAQGVLDKVIDHIDQGAAGFIAASPFVVLSTSSEDRADSSPRGGPPGFVRVLDRQHLAWGDLVGNNRLDSFGNLLTRPAIGMLFLVPGVLETLRVRGTAELVQEPDVLDACALDGRPPKTAVVVRVDECYIHCGAALRRSDLWNPDSWPVPSARPPIGAVLRGHMGSSTPAEEIEAGLARYYDNFVWVPGGRQD